MEPASWLLLLLAVFVLFSVFAFFLFPGDPERRENITAASTLLLALATIALFAATYQLYSETVKLTAGDERQNLILSVNSRATVCFTLSAYHRVFQREAASSDADDSDANGAWADVSANAGVALNQCLIDMPTVEGSAPKTEIETMRECLVGVAARETLQIATAKTTFSNNRRMQELPSLLC